MDWGVGIALLLVGAIGFSIRWVLEWFIHLNEEALTRTSELSLEDPSSLNKVPRPSLYAEASKALSIIVPAYNEQLRLPSTLDETLRYLQHRRDREGANFTYEVIVVDDGSADNTAEKSFELTKQYGFDTVRVLQLPMNRGKGFAVKAGMLMARGQQLLMMDADGATRVSDLGKLQEQLSKLARIPARGTEGQLAMAVGSRAHLEADALARRHWFRNFLMRGFHLLVMFVAGGTVRDSQCGFKLFTRGAAQLLYGNQRLQRWCFDVELLYLASQLQIPVAEVAVAWTEIPGSKIKATSIIHMLWEMGAIVVAYRWLNCWHIQTEAELVKARA